MNKKQAIGFAVLIVGIALVVFAFQSMNRLASDRHQSGNLYASPSPFELRDSSHGFKPIDQSLEVKSYFNAGLTLIAVGTGLAIFCRRRVKGS